MKTDNQIVKLDNEENKAKIRRRKKKEKKKNVKWKVHNASVRLTRGSYTQANLSLSQHRLLGGEWLHILRISTRFSNILYSYRAFENTQYHLIGDIDNERFEIRLLI